MSKLFFHFFILSFLFSVLLQYSLNLLLHILSFILCSLQYESAFKRITCYKNFKLLYHYYSYHLYYFCQYIIKCLLHSHYFTYNLYLRLSSYLVFYSFFSILHVSIKNRSKVEYLYINFFFNSGSIQWVRQHSLNTICRHNHCTKTIEEIPKIRKTCHLTLVSLEPVRVTSHTMSNSRGYLSHVQITRV